MRTSKSHVRKLVVLPLTVVPIVFGSAGVALAASPTGSSSSLPADQIALSSSCVTLDQVVAAGKQAEAQYVPGGPPAGVIVNGNWLPEAAAPSAGKYVDANGCVVLASTQVIAALPSDQITITGTCPTLSQVTAAAEEAIRLYADWGPPAGVIVNGNWFPAGVASGAYTECPTAPTVPITGSSAALPSNQVTLSSSCVTLSQVVAAGKQAAAQYMPGASPAGVIINGTWLPAAMAPNVGKYVDANGCVVLP